MLPQNVIRRLKDGDTGISQSHDSVTILFSDVVSFTSMSASINTGMLVKILNEMFTAFDKLCDTYGVYKVETIGDAYMVVCGHAGHQDHAKRVIDMGRAMLREVKKIIRPHSNGKHLQIRVGIHTGPAMSGVVELDAAILFLW